MSQWIWNATDFELYHYMKLSCRREEKDHDYPCVWPITRPGVSACFVKTVNNTRDTRITAVTRGRGMIRLNGHPYPVNRELNVPAGKYDVEIHIDDVIAFPSVYIDDECFGTDASWQAEAYDKRFRPVGCEPAYTHADGDPTVYPFSYSEIVPISTEKTDDGLLLDYGKEYFACVTLAGFDRTGPVTLVYGESREEAMDGADAIVQEELDGPYDPVRPARALRWLRVICAEPEKAVVKTEYEYLPITDKAYFRCNDPMVEKIWDVSSHTFHLNSRECYLDGIKRDRWVWSGDAYQSFMINRYLYSDPAIVRRTITALLGKPPYRRHVNTINDYTAYLIMSLRDHLYATNDTGFVKSIWDEVKELFRFAYDRLDENGYVVQRENDWIFIDWGVMDKDGPLAAEQFLLIEMYRAMSELAAAVGDEDVYTAHIAQLEKNIRRDYWDEEKGCYIDSFTSGKRFVSRQSNVFAVLFGYATKDETDRIVKNVFDNDSVPPITTPYFKLYELMALCKVGRIREMQEYITGYWGDMLRLGATSVWEQYLPNENGREHLAMYGEPYGRSLCHAWGSGPIYLLGRYCAGVRQTGPDYESFAVEPDPGIYTDFDAAVPVGKGIVKVSWHNGVLEAESDVPGGTLRFNGVEKEMKPFEKLTVGV